MAPGVYLLCFLNFGSIPHSVLFIVKTLSQLDHIFRKRSYANNTNDHTEAGIIGVIIFIVNKGL